MSTNRGGRAKKDPSEKRSKRPSVNLTYDEYREIEKKAQRTNKSISEFLKTSAFKTEIIEADKGIGKLLRLLGYLRDILTDLPKEILDDAQKKSIHEVIRSVSYENQNRLSRDLLKELKRIGVNINQISKNLNKKVAVYRDDSIRHNLDQCDHIISNIKVITQNLSHESERDTE